ncbi:MAG: hypothetical protein SVO01_00330 [Thermotogota bacterium]|nr:hypothetical protein [Thermotogota bacterium]
MKKIPFLEIDEIDGFPLGTYEGFMACTKDPDNISPISGTFYCKLKQAHISVILCNNFQKDNFFGCRDCKQGKYILSLLKKRKEDNDTLDTDKNNVKRKKEAQWKLQRLHFCTRGLVCKECGSIEVRYIKHNLCDKNVIAN